MTTFDPPTYSQDGKTYVPVLVVKYQGVTQRRGCALLTLEDLCGGHFAPCMPGERADGLNVTFKPAAVYELTGDDQYGWTIQSMDDPMQQVHIQAILYDGSGRKDKYPDGIIKTRAEQKAWAEKVLNALNGLQ